MFNASKRMDFLLSFKLVKMRYCNICGWSENHPHDGFFYCPQCDIETYFSSDDEWEEFLQEADQK